MYLILSRIKLYPKDIIEDNKCGKSTINHIFIVKQLVEKHYEFNNDLHLFIDYKQARMIQLIEKFYRMHL
jgi:hypothetical protein